jgi:hypothetical protein
MFFSDTYFIRLQVGRDQGDRRKADFAAEFRGQWAPWNRLSILSGVGQPLRASFASKSLLGWQPVWSESAIHRIDEGNLSGISGTFSEERV